MELLIPSPSLAGTPHPVPHDTFCGEGRRKGKKEKGKRWEEGKGGKEEGREDWGVTLQALTYSTVHVPVHGSKGG